MSVSSKLLALVSFVLLGSAITTGVHGRGKPVSTQVGSDLPTAGDCLATIESGVQTDDRCPSPTSDKASITAVIAQTRKIDSSCPSPTRKDNGGNCVLDEDIVLSVPLELDSFTHLNCKGHRMLPQATGVEGAVGVYAPSVPEVAIALIGAHGSHIQNCVIGSPDRRIDFAIVVIASKGSGTQSDRLLGNKILSNAMHVRGVGVTLFAADDNQISDNDITWDGSGVGIKVDRDSDRNRITHNTLSSSTRLPRYVRNTPGNDSAALTGITDVGVLNADLPTFPLYNFIIGGRLVQLTNMGDTRVEENLFEENSVFLPGPHTGKNHGGIVVASLSSRAAIRGNTVMGGRPGIRSAGFSASTAVTLPGKCSLDSNRSCVTNADCNLAGFDVSTLGSCSSIGPATILDGRAYETIVEGNTLIGPFGEPGGIDQLDAAIASFGNTVNGVVRNNRVSALGSSFGITVSNEGLKTVVVTRNVIDGARVGLNLRMVNATFFGARIFLNDLVNSLTAAVTTTGPYTLPTQLSVAGAGNYWGHSVAPGFSVADTNNALVADGYPFCQPVAAWVGPSPAPCP